DFFARRGLTPPSGLRRVPRRRPGARRDAPAGAGRGRRLRRRGPPDHRSARPRRRGRRDPEGARVTEKQTLKLYEKTGALMHGHFRLTSGLHSDIYLQSALVLQYPEHAATLGTALAAPLRHAGAATVLPPALDGILVAHEAARALGVPARPDRQRGHQTGRPELVTPAKALGRELREVEDGDAA